MIHANAVPVSRRQAVVLAGVSLIGVVLFTWPLLIAQDATVAGWRDAPFLFALLIALLLAVAASEVSSGGIDAKAIAVLDRKSVV